MKNITRILTLVLVCFFASSAVWAQSADDAFKAYKSLRDDKEAKPNAAYFQKLCAAGTDFLAQFPGDKRAREVVNGLLSYGTGNLAKEKALRAAWFSQVQYALIDKQPAVDDKAKTAFAALSAAMAEGEFPDNSSGQTVNEWRGKIDKLDGMPNAQGFKLDREKGFYNTLSRGSSPVLKRIVEAQLAELSNSKDKDTANWAKQESKLNELRKTPLTLSFAALDGKAFDSTKLKGPPALYLYFWSATGKNIEKEAEALMDMYYEFTRRQVEFVAVNCDPEEKRAEVQAFVKKQKIKCPVYFDGQGTKGDLCQKLNVTNVSGGALGYFFDAKGAFVDRGVKPGDLKKYIR